MGFDIAGQELYSLLNTISSQLFGGEKPNIPHNIILHVLKEAEAQTVFSLAFAFLQKELTIISAGNFDELTVDSKSVLLQAFDAVNKKACDDFRFIGKHRLLLPIGWLAEGGKYFRLLVTGKRKSKGTSKMLKEAAKRKNIYSTMELFVDNQKI